jgi:uncharacterized protein YecE (DUF72 family)
MTMPGRFFCGTSGWNYKHWRGIFYPESLPQRAWLQFYAQHFDTVEINNSFYRLPERSTFEAWHDQTPDGFTFAVKASRFLTHIKRLVDPQEPLERMLGHSEALGKKHGPVLYQLPPYFHVNTDRLENTLSLLPKNMRHVFEFRDQTWQTDEVYDLLRGYGAGYCIMSSPDLPCHIMSTTDFAYIRMHNGGSETDGNYTDEGLRRWAEQVQALREHGDVYMYFNNDYMGYALRNAERLKELLP